MDEPLLLPRLVQKWARDILGARGYMRALNGGPDRRVLQEIAILVEDGGRDETEIGAIFAQVAIRRGGLGEVLEELRKPARKPQAPSSRRAVAPSSHAGPGTASSSSSAFAHAGPAAGAARTRSSIPAQASVAAQQASSRSHLPSRQPAAPPASPTASSSPVRSQVPTAPMAPGSAQRALAASTAGSVLAYTTAEASKISALEHELGRVRFELHQSRRHAEELETLARELAARAVEDATRIQALEAVVLAIADGSGIGGDARQVHAAAIQRYLARFALKAS